MQSNKIIKTAIIKITGIHCNSCKLLIEDVCQNIKGIKSCEVDSETGRTVIEYDESFNWNSLKKEVEVLGQYKLQLNP